MRVFVTTLAVGVMTTGALYPEHRDLAVASLIGTILVWAVFSAFDADPEDIRQ